MAKPEENRLVEIKTDREKLIELAVILESLENTRNQLLYELSPSGSDEEAKKIEKNIYLDELPYIKDILNFLRIDGEAHLKLTSLLKNLFKKIPTLGET